MSNKDNAQMLGDEEELAIQRAVDASVQPISDNLAALARRVESLKNVRRPQTCCKATSPIRTIAPLRKFSDISVQTDPEQPHPAIEWFNSLEPFQVEELKRLLGVVPSQGNEAPEGVDQQREEVEEPENVEEQEKAREEQEEENEEKPEEQLGMVVEEQSEFNVEMELEKDTEAQPGMEIEGTLEKLQGQEQAEDEQEKKNNEKPEEQLENRAELSPESNVEKEIKEKTEEQQVMIVDENLEEEEQVVGEQEVENEDENLGEQAEKPRKMHSEKKLGKKRAAGQESRRQDNKKCSNCGVENTPTWRRNAAGEIVCNPCGQYSRNHRGANRPSNLFKQVKRVKRGP